MKSIGLGTVTAIGIGIGIGLTGCGTAPPPSGTTGEPDPPAATVDFHDDFEDDRNEWGVIDGEFGKTYYEDGEYVWETTGSNVHWQPLMFIPEEFGGIYTGDPDLTDVRIRTELTIVSGEGVAGVFCREAPDTDAEAEWYEFVARDGFAAIRRADLESNLEVLASTDTVQLPAGEEFALEATCRTGDTGSAQLTLLIDGREVLSVEDDDPIPTGVVGQQGYTHPVHEPMTVRWNSFTVTAP